MRKNTAFFLSAIGVVLTLSISAQTSGQKNNTQENQHGYVPGQPDNPYGDYWYGPGFYYGTWYDNEQDYWGWRREHPDYPPNREYYNHDHPVEYHPEGRGRGRR